MDFRGKFDRYLHRLGDALFLLRDRLDKLSPPSWRDVRDAAGNVSPVDWSRLRTLKGWRDMLRERPGVVAGFCAVLLLMSSAIGITGMSRRRVEYPPLWFLDAGTGRLYLVPANTPSPSAPPSGAKLSDGQPGGVRAYVYACGDCADEGKRKAYHVERLTPDAIAVMQGGAPLPAEYEADGGGGMDRFVEANSLVARADSLGEWKRRATDEGTALLEQLDPCPDGSEPVACRPSDKR